MKQFILLLTLLGIAFTGKAQLIITGVLDGPLTGGTPKAIELYALEDISDLSIYGVGSANNGGGTDGEEFTFPAISAQAGDFIYVASEKTNFTTFLGFPPNFTGSVAFINGDDAVELFKDGVVIDVYGDPNVNGDFEAWDYSDGWGYRNNNTAAATMFDSNNWSYSGRDSLDGDTLECHSQTSFSCPQLFKHRSRRLC